MKIIEKFSTFGPSEFNIPTRVIIHAMAEYIKFKGKVYHAIEWLEYKGWSAHRFFPSTGEIIVTRNDDQRAHHAKGFNEDSLGAEVLVPGVHDYGTFVKAIAQPWTSPEQMKALIWQSLEWRKVYNLSISDFNRHSDIDPLRKVDPGDGFPWGEYRGQLTLYPEEF